MAGLRRSWTLLGHTWTLLALLALLVGAVPIGLAGCDRGEGGQAPTGGTSAITVSCRTKVGDLAEDQHGQTYRVVGVAQTSGGVRHVSLAQDTTSGGSGGSSGDTTIIVTVNCPTDSPTITNPPPEAGQT